jgi:hypothetical protein
MFNNQWTQPPKPFLGTPQGQANQPVMSQPAPQLGSATGITALPQAPQWGPPTPVLGFASGGPIASHEKDRIVKEAQLAVGGKHPNARMAIQRFEGVMGPEATSDLIRAYATGGRIRGSGGGVDDLIPGSIDGREDVRLASGEYVIPARVVSALGDGDSDRGVQILDEFVARVRAKGAQMMMGADPIDARSMRPEI